MKYSIEDLNAIALRLEGDRKAAYQDYVIKKKRTHLDKYILLTKQKKGLEVAIGILISLAVQEPKN